MSNIPIESFAPKTPKPPKPDSNPSNPNSDKPDHSSHPDYHSMIKADLEALIVKYSEIALTDKGVNPRWIAALRIAELFL